MDFWGLSRSAFYHEAFQTQAAPTKPSKDLIEKLNAVALSGPAGNKEYFQGLMKDVLGVTAPVIREGFQTTGSTLDQMLAWIDATSTATPPTYSTSADTTTLSQIDQLEAFWTSADATRTQLLEEIRAYIWSKVTEFKTIVGNVSSLGRTLTADEALVNGYTETITGMEESGLVEAWNKYTAAIASLTSGVDAQLATKIVDYNNLLTKYDTFRGTSSVGNIDMKDAANNLEEYPIPSGSAPRITLDILKGTDSIYAAVNEYFGTTGFLEKMRAFVGSELRDWEAEYFTFWNALTPEVKAQYNYVRPNDIPGMSAQQLISTMNSFMGVADSPAPAATGLVTRLTTGTIQQQALAAIRQFYQLAVEGMIVVRLDSDIAQKSTTVPVPGNPDFSIDGIETVNVPMQTVTLASLYSGLGTSLSVVTSTLAETNTVELAKIKFRYEYGANELSKYIEAQFRMRVAESMTLKNLLESSISVPADVPTSLTLDAWRINAYTYFITYFPNLVSTYQSLFQSLNEQNQTLQSKAAMLGVSEVIPTTLDVSARLAVPPTAGTTIFPTNMTGTYPPASYSETVSGIRNLSNVIRTLTDALQRHLNYRNRVSTLVLNAVTGSNTSYTTTNDPAVLKSTYEQTRENLRTTVWSAVSTFQTRVKNVASVYPLPPATLTATETEVNGFEEGAVKGQDIAALAESWSKYTTANDTFIPNANAALLNAWSVFDRLYRTYDRFYTLPAVVNISNITSLSVIGIPNIPSIQELQSKNYEKVAQYFSANIKDQSEGGNGEQEGIFYALLNSIRDQLATWEDAYYAQWNSLPANVKQQYPYEDITNIPSMSAEELMDMMNRFGGVGAIDAPAAAPTGLVTQLITGTLQQQTIQVIRQFYKMLLENLVVFTSTNAIPDTSFAVPTKSVAIAGQTITSTATNTNLLTLTNTLSDNVSFLSGKLDTTLSQREQAAIATTKASYEEGMVQLFAFVKSEFKKRIEEYGRLSEVKEAFEMPVDPIAADLTTVNGASTSEALASLRYSYSIVKYKALVDAMQPVLGTLLRDNETLRNTDTTVPSSEKPALPTLSLPSLTTKTEGTLDTISMAAPNPCSTTDKCGPTDILPDLIANYDEFATFFPTYFSSTLPAIYDLQKMMDALRVGLMVQLNFRNQMKAMIFQSMYSTLQSYGFNQDRPYSLPPWTTKNTVADIIADYATYNGSLVDYVGKITPDVSGAIVGYSKLYTNYNTFRRNALRITETGAPAPSSYLRNEPIIDTDIADLNGFEAPAQDTLTGKTGIALQNALVEFGKKYGMDGRSISTMRDNTDLLPKLLERTSAEVADYINQYGARFSTLSATTRTLASPAAIQEDRDALKVENVRVETILEKMASYGNLTTGLLEAVDRDAVWDRMDEFLNTYMYSNAVASVATLDSVKAQLLSAQTKSADYTNVATSIVVPSEVGADIPVVEGTTNPVEINRLFNKYNGAYTVFTSKVTTDLKEIQQVFSTLLATYSTFYTTYNEFMQFAGATWTTAGAYPFTSMALSEYTDANTDAAVRDIAAGMGFMRTNLLAFQTAVGNSVGPGKSIHFTDVPMMASNPILARMIPDVARGADFVGNVGSLISLLGPYGVVLGDMNTYMTRLKTQYRTVLQGMIGGRTGSFLDIYDAQLKTAMNEMGEGTSVPAELSAQYVCDTSKTSLSLQCKDTSVSSEIVGASGMAIVGTFESGYPYVDAATIEQETMTQKLVQYQQKYADLIAKITELKVKLLGVNMLRPIMIQYASDWYNVYAKNKDAIDAYGANSAQSYTTFVRDLGVLRTYFPDIDRNSFSKQSPAFNQLTESQLKSTFEPYFMGQVESPGKPAIQEGPKYRNLLTLFAETTSAVIDTFITKYNEEDMQTYLRIRPEILGTMYPEFQSISFTNADKSKLASPTISYDSATPEGILQIFNKYRGTSGYINKMNEAYGIGNASAKYRNGAKDAIDFFGSVYDIFAASLFSDPQELSSPILPLVNNRALFVSGGYITDALKQKSDDELIAIKDLYYKSTPEQDGKPNYSILLANNASSLTTIPNKALNLVANIKQALGRRILAFKQKYHANDNDSLWRLPNAVQFTSNYFDISTIDADIAGHLRNVNDATSSDALINIIQNYTSTEDGRPGYENVLQTYIDTLKDIRQKRVAAKGALEQFAFLIAMFQSLEVLPGIIPGYDIMTQNITNINYSPLSSTVTNAFNRKDSAALQVLVDQFNANNGTNYTELLRAVGEAIKAKMDSYLNTYTSAGTDMAPSPSLFTDKYATKNRLGAYAPSVQDVQFVSAQVQADKQKVDAAVEEENAFAMLELLKAYVGSGSQAGYISQLQTIIGNLRGERTQRLSVEQVLSKYYSQFFYPLSGRGQLLDGYESKNAMLADLMNNWLQAGSNGNYELRETFFEKSRAELDAIAAKYTRVMPASVPSSTFPALNIKAPRSNASITNMDPGRPDIETAPILYDIRYQMYMVIKDTVDDYNKFCYLFVLPGIQLDKDLAAEEFTTIVGNDVITLQTATVMDIQTIQQKYLGAQSLKAKIGEIAGPLFATSGLRDTIASAATAYTNTYNKFFNNLFKNSPFNGPEYQAMVADMSGACSAITASNYQSLALNCFYNVSDPSTSGIYTISDNAILTCVKRRFLNPENTKYQPETTEETKSVSGCNPLYATTENAYNRLLAACRVAMQKRIDDCLKFYNDNVSQITLDGSRTPHMDLTNIATFTAADKSSMNGSGAALEAAIASMQSKYYTKTANSSMGMFDLIQSEINGGGAVGEARNNFKTAIRKFKEVYDDFAAVLYKPDESRYQKVLRQTVVAKYAEIMGDSAASTTKWLYSDNGTIKQTKRFNDLQDIPAIDAQTTLFVTERANLIADINSTLKNVVSAFYQKYAQNQALFNEVQANGWIVSLSLTTALQQAERDTNNAFLSTGTLEDCKKVYSKFFVGQTLTGGTIQPYLNELDNAIVGALKAKAQYRTRDSMIRLFDLYNRYNVLGIQKPAALTEAETYVTFVPGTPTITTYLGPMNNATPALLTGDAAGAGNGGIKGQMDAAYPVLMTDIRTKLIAFIESYKALRNRFLDFYEENKGTYFTDPTFDGILASRTDDDSTDTRNIATLRQGITFETEPVLHSVFEMYLKASDILMGFVKGFFSNDKGAIAVYTAQYTSLFVPTATARSRVEVAAPFASLTTTRDLEVAQGPTSLSDLTRLVTTYDERFDYVRLSKARLAAAMAIQAYWSEIAEYGALAAAEMEKDIYKKSFTYVNFDNKGSPTYPFTSLFMQGQVPSYYDAIRQEYEGALSVFQGSRRKVVQDTVQYFHETVWKKYEDAMRRGANGSSVSYGGDMRVVATKIVADGSIDDTVTQMVAAAGTPYMVGSESVSARTMFTRMREFIKSAELFFLSTDYKNCIIRDIEGRNTLVQNSQNQAIQKLLGGSFEPFAQEPRGTSRWAFF